MHPAIDPASLPEDPKLLRDLLLKLLAELQARDEKIEKLTLWNQELRQRQFGRKTEATTEENQQLLSFLIQGVAALKPEVAPPPAPAPSPKPPTRHEHGRARLPEALPRVDVVHDVPKEEQICGDCGKPLVVIGQAVSEQVEYQPACLHVKRDVRLKYACGEAKCRGTVKLAELPPKPVPKGKAAEGMMAFVMTNKYAHHLPWYRQEEILANLGLPVTRSTMWNWTLGGTTALEPLYEAMKKAVQSSPIVETDETPVRLWDPEHQVMRQGRQWVYINQDHTVFEFTPDRKAKHPKAFLKDTKGYLVSDAYSGYRSIAEESKGLINVFCWAHVRRMFWKAKETDAQRSAVGMAYIQALYRVESEARGQKPEKVKELRQRDAKPLLAKFHGWLAEQGLMVRPKSPIGKAIGYALNQWPELQRYLEDGRLRIDNNRSEQQLRPIAVGRKNWLRHEAESGGKVAAILSSLIASCRRHGKNPFDYLKDVLSRIATHPAKDILDLSPVRWKPPPKPNSS
jgi:transposase